MKRIVRQFFRAALAVLVVGAVALFGFAVTDCTAAQLAAVKQVENSAWEGVDCAAFADVTYDLAVAVAVERGAPMPDATLRPVLEAGCERERTRILDGGAWMATRPATLSVSDGGGR